MKPYLLLIIIYLQSNLFYSVPSGTYKIMGYAIFEGHSRIPKQKIIVNQTDTIVTDINGFYTYTVKWEGDTRFYLFNKKTQKP